MLWWPQTLCVLAVLAVFACLWSPAVRAASPSTQPEFTAGQAEAGQATYATRCATCHGPALEGRAGPALSGPQFSGEWASGQRTLGDLLYVLRTMPLDAPGSLSAAQYASLAAFILSRNGYQAGSTLLDDGANAERVLPSAVMGTATRQSDTARLQRQFPEAPRSILKASGTVPDDADLLRPDAADWLMYNKSFDGQRYSTLTQISRHNAGKLAPVCIFQLGEVGAFQTSPVIFKGLMYVTTPLRTLAVDAATCVQRWEHIYSPPDVASNMQVNRGVAIYRGKLFRATPDGHLIALDAHTGALLWDARIADPSIGYWLTMAPLAYHGRVFIGTAGSEMSASGRIHALDTETGRVLWTFHVIPTGDALGAETWKTGAEHGGGSMWSTFTLEPAENLLLASVGNPAPDYDGAARYGNNLYTNSVVALDYRTGKLIWYVQQIPHDFHDWDTAAAPIAYELDGRRYLAVANKGGWLYIYDRDNRELLSKTEVSPHVNADVPLSTEPLHYCPGNNGGVAWNGPAFSPPLRRLYVNSVHWCGTTRLADYRYIPGMAYVGGIHTFDPSELARGFTRAVDAATGKEIWARESSAQMLAGLTPTAGGVLLTGEFSGYFLVLDAASGKDLYRFYTGGGLAGGISTYMVGKHQFVAVVSGNQSAGAPNSKGAATIVVFTLRT